MRSNSSSHGEHPIRVLNRGQFNFYLSPFLYSQRDGTNMVCVVTMHEKPDLKDPVLIEGLPGIGFVANIAALHIIRNLKAKLFAEINCSSFQDFAVTVEGGQTRHPINELYYYKGEKEQRDLLILYGNTQALTSTGQYELCGKILDLSEELGCHYVVTLGGLKREREIKKPKLYFAATDEEVAQKAHVHFIFPTNVKLFLEK